MSQAAYSRDLDRRAANHQPLTPLGFLGRAAEVFPERCAIIHGRLRRSYAEFNARARRLASGLSKLGIGRGDTVAALLPNIPAMLECHYGVPMAGAVLNALNIRLDARTIAFSLDHGEAKALIVDCEFAGLARAALRLAKAKPVVVDVDDPEFAGLGEEIGGLDYEALLASGDPGFAWVAPEDEWDAIALNCTSGTTGDPKGVVYHHRSAHLLALGNIVTCAMGKHPVYLWTVKDARPRIGGSVTGSLHRSSLGPHPPLWNATVPVHQARVNGAAIFAAWSLPGDARFTHEKTGLSRQAGPSWGRSGRRPLRRIRQGGDWTRQ